MVRRSNPCSAVTVMPFLVVALTLAFSPVPVVPVVSVVPVSAFYYEVEGG